MKKIILLLAYLFFFLSTNAQQDTTFNKLIKSYTGTLSISSVLRLDSNYYALISQLDTPYTAGIGYKTGIGVIHFDKKYKIVDSVIINLNIGIAANRGHGFDINPQDTSFIYCGLIRDINTRENGYLVKFDKNLDTLWTLQIPHPDTAYADTAATPWVALRDVKVTPSGD